MRHYKVLALSIAVVGLLLSPPALADCAKHDEAAESAPCCAKKAQLAKAELKDCCKQAGGRENCEKCTATATATATAAASKDCCKQAGNLEDCDNCSASVACKDAEACEDCEKCSATASDSTDCCKDAADREDCGKCSTCEEAAASAKAN